MKKFLTIDFDIIMHQSIELYNDYDGTADEYLSQFDFIHTVPADLELYEKLTSFLMEQYINKKEIIFMNSHDEMIKLTKNQGPFELVNIDHHHDLGYGDNVRWSLPVREVDCGNWVKKMWDLNRITKYIWIKDFQSQDPPIRANQFISEKYFINDNKILEKTEFEKIFICFSPEWIPNNYQHLFNIWKILFKEKDNTKLTKEIIESAEQLSFDFK